MKKTGEWGEFLPQECGCFAYNESTAAEFFPLRKEEALRRGYRWRENEEQALAKRVIPSEKLPDAITDIPDDILQWAIRCDRTGRQFKITSQELQFYRSQKIPVPRMHPDVRYTDRMAAYSNSPQLFARTCMKCQKEIQTTYAPERPEIVYCEECYLKEVY